MMTRPAASAQTGMKLTVAVRAFIRVSQFAGSWVRLSNPSLYLRHPDMQPKVRELMAPRAHLSSSSLKTLVFLARIRTR